jgi:hypothetical protein
MAWYEVLGSVVTIVVIYGGIFWLSDRQEKRDHEARMAKLQEVRQKAKKAL